MSSRIISYSALNRAVGDVTRELDELGFWSSRMDEIEVKYQYMPSMFLGYFRHECPEILSVFDITEGDIYVPALSLSRLDERPSKYSSLRDVVRHEYGHGFAHKYPRLTMQSREFGRIFGGGYDSHISSEFDPGFHLTKYAATEPCEDYAECFMAALRCKGEIDRYQNRPGLYRKLNWVLRLAEKM